MIRLARDRDEIESYPTFLMALHTAQPQLEFRYAATALAIAISGMA